MWYCGAVALWCCWWLVGWLVGPPWYSCTVVLCGPVTITRLHLVMTLCGTVALCGTLALCGDVVWHGVVTLCGKGRIPGLPPPEMPPLAPA